MVGDPSSYAIHSWADRGISGDSDKALGCVLSLLSDQLYDLYMDYTNPTELWDALERKFTVSEGGRLLYTCEQFYDFSVDVVK